MKILSAAQIRELDKKTIGGVEIFVGPGNNGGDGLVIGRLLSQKFFEVRIWICHLSEKFSSDFLANQAKLPTDGALEIIHLKLGNDYTIFEEPGIIIDAILGTGISKPIDDYWSSLIDGLNSDLSERVSVDIPTGMYPDQPCTGTIFKADCTFTFEIPKLAFLLPSYIPYVGKLVFGQIGLNPQVLYALETDKYLLTQYQVASILKERPETGHKGTFGHALLTMGSYGKMGAAILAARACLRSGIGLVTTHIPRSGYPIMQSSFPEAMVSVDKDEFYISQFPDVDKFEAIGVGCGMDNNDITEKALMNFLSERKQPVLLDADALNILAEDRSRLQKIPKGSILTPHPGEFERLFGKSENDFERIELLKNMALDLGIFILLKGSRSCLASPNGNLFFNSTGNSGMATAGSGDVLSGMITGLMAQGYNTQEAGLLGMYLHGMAGDLAAQEGPGEEAMVASDIVNNIGNAYKALQHIF